MPYLVPLVPVWLCQRQAVCEAVWCLALPGFYLALPWDTISKGAGGTGLVVLPAQPSTDLAQAGQLPPPCSTYLLPPKEGRDKSCVWRTTAKKDLWQRG